MGRILRWGLLQLCQSLVNGLYFCSPELVVSGNFNHTPDGCNIWAQA